MKTPDKKGAIPLRKEIPKIKYKVNPIRMAINIFDSIFLTYPKKTI